MNTEHMNRHANLIQAMIEYEQGCPQRAQHFLKVFGFAKTIGELENLDARTQLILETAAIVHDIGIKPSLVKYGDADGKHQEAEGPPIARPLLANLGYDEDTVERVCWLIAHHHTYQGIQGLDYQILVEADFLVNIYETQLSQEAIRKVFGDFFVTETGRKFCRMLYPQE